MMRELDDAILRARFDESVHVLVLRGAADKFFCAGADIKRSNSVSPRYKYYSCLFWPPHKAALAVGRIKRAICSGPENSFTEGLGLERELQQQLLESEDPGEGPRAYPEKRTPRFKGC